MGFNSKEELMNALTTGPIVNEKGTVVTLREDGLYKYVTGRLSEERCNYTFSGESYKKWSKLDRNALPDKSEFTAVFKEIPFFGGLYPVGNFPYWKALKGKKVRITIEKI